MAEQPIVFTGYETPQAMAQKLNELEKRQRSNPTFDKLRVGASGLWLNDESITATGITLTDDAVTGYVLTCDANGVASWGEPPAGGSDPGGAAATLQYNNAGVLGGVAGSLWDGTDLTLPASIQASGDLDVVGRLAGGCDSRTFGDNSGAVTASKYLKMVNGVLCDAARGYPMARPGSIVDIALMFYVNSYTLGAEIRAVAKVNGSGSFSCGASPSGSAPFVMTAYDDQNRGLNTFSAGEVLQIYLTVSGTINIGYIEATLGLQFDT